MKFSKEKFLKNADKSTKDRVRPHLDVLDGLMVEENHMNTGYGIIYYEVDGEKFLLYPVYDEWCEV